MGNERIRCARGITLLEVLLATVVVSVAATGVLSYEYHAARQTQRASVHAEAVRLGYFLLEDWKANGGSALYADGRISGVANPVALGFVRIKAGIYQITLDAITMQVNLSLDYVDYHRDLTRLTVTVRWPGDFKNFSMPISNNPSVVLSTYARIDEAGG